MPNSQPEFPAGTHAPSSPASTKPSQPARSASSLPGKSTLARPLPVECTSVLRRTANRLRAGMLLEAQFSTSLALIDRNGGTYAVAVWGTVRCVALKASYWACISSRALLGVPKAFSIRVAMSADRAAFPFSRFESAGRPTPISSAALVTGIFGGITSALIRTPGWGTSSNALICCSCLTCYSAMFL